MQKITYTIRQIITCSPVYVCQLLASILAHISLMIYTNLEVSQLFPLLILLQLNLVQRPIQKNISFIRFSYYFYVPEIGFELTFEMSSLNNIRLKCIIHPLFFFNTHLDKASSHLHLRFFFFFFLEKRVSMGPVYCSWDSQTSFFSKTFIKNWSHGTIHTFKNYFVTVFSVFSFQQNKRYPNTLLIFF